MVLLSRPTHLSTSSCNSIVIFYVLAELAESSTTSAYDGVTSEQLLVCKNRQRFASLIHYLQESCPAAHMASFPYVRMGSSRVPKRLALSYVADWSIIMWVVAPST